MVTKTPLDKLKERVKETKNQRKVAAELGIPPSLVSAILAGRRNIPEALAEKLGFRLEWVAVEAGK